ncbi:MAG TPA: ABC transporter permease [Planctomycetota bacterium]|nr:ABC transporter permease [Planctomycetota bacterium]
MYKLFMAFRYLRAHKIIYFSIVGVTLGIMTMVVVTSLMGGFSRDMKSRIRGMQTDIVVMSYDKNLWITDYQEICKSIEAIPHVRGCAPRLEYDAWLGRSGSYTDVHIVGIIPSQERKVSELATFFRKGLKEKFDFEDDVGTPTRNPGVVLGAELQRAGSTIGLLTARQGTTPILCVKDFDVVGRFRSGMVEYDSNYVFMDIAAAQEFLQVTGKPSANVLAVAVDDYERYGQTVRAQILDTFHARRPCMHPEDHGPGTFYNMGFRCGPFRAQTWEQTRRVLLQAVEVEKGMMYILLSFIVLVAGFNIVAIYTLVVRAKTRDIGILRALGGTEGGVTSVFLLSGGLCGFIGSIFGIVLGLLLALNLNEVLDFIRVVSREMNRMGLVTAVPLNSVPRGATIAAGASLLAALGLLVWNWRLLYKERKRHPWTRMIAAGVLLGIAAWYATGWMPDYRPNDRYDADFGPRSRWMFSGAIVLMWAAFCGLWRFLDRYRRRPSWIFFGFGATLFMSAAILGVSATLAIAAGILWGQPDSSWPGLELFSRKIYYLDRVPVFVDYGALVYIVIWTLFVSFCCSIYPALRAAAANPVEAIRDE